MNKQEIESEEYWLFELTICVANWGYRNVILPKNHTELVQVYIS